MYLHPLQSTSATFTENGLGLDGFLIASMDSPNLMLRFSSHLLGNVPGASSSDSSQCDANYIKEINLLKASRVEQ